MQKPNFIIPYLIITIVILFIIGDTFYPRTYLPHGVALQVSKPLPPTTIKQVQVYSSAPANKQYRVLAIVNVEIHGPYTENMMNPQIIQAIQYERKLAANIGVNGLIITSVDYLPTISAYLITSQAISLQNHFSS